MVIEDNLPSRTVEEVKSCGWSIKTQSKMVDGEVTKQAGPGPEGLYK